MELRYVLPATSVDRTWVTWAVGQITADTRRSADTHLLRLPRAGDQGIQLYLKDESTHPTGSLKHRLARSLFLYALCNGDIGPGTTVVEASSGSKSSGSSSTATPSSTMKLPCVSMQPLGRPVVPEV